MCMCISSIPRSSTLCLPFLRFRKIPLMLSSDSHAFWLWFIFSLFHLEQRAMVGRRVTLFTSFAHKEEPQENKIREDIIGNAI
ncbi:unnamed protein product [Amoebophrya sp. A120]|nr:unnamed protein product [Amoebophrya sp. A120]|eukprot:GSA120T00023778001.1